MRGADNKKTVTVILPNYNYVKYIDDRIDEIINQTYPVSEIVILDDASDDGSVQKIEQRVKNLRAEYPELKIQTVFNKKNSGNVFSQWAKGINLATSDYIWIAEMDDSAKPKFLEKLIRSFDDEDVVFAYSNSKLVNQNNKPLVRENLRKVKDFFRKKHSCGSYTVSGQKEMNKNLAIYNSIPNVSAVVFKNRSVLDDYLKEAKKYVLCGDWYFYLRVANEGKIHYCSKKLNIHRIHEKSVTKRTSLRERFKETQRVHEYALKNYNLSEKAKKRMIQLEAKLAEKWH
ncbi:glycosyltransferase [Candidatus Saccharibacteria bacterium]|nr:glycosyltransferase [Candidatus Saccharibacteria bacterium]